MALINQLNILSQIDSMPIADMGARGSILNHV